MDAKTILKIDASARYQDSVTRQLSQELVMQLQQKYPGAQVVERDLAVGVPFVHEAMVMAYNTPDEARSPEQQALLQPSNELVAELQSADVVVIGTPIIMSDEIEQIYKY